MIETEGREWRRLRDGVGWLVGTCKWYVSKHVNGEQ
jgi:hypothetical protein